MVPNGVIYKGEKQRRNHQLHAMVLKDELKMNLKIHVKEL